MDCKYCGVALLDDEIQDGMCDKCPKYCFICENVLPWERLECEHEDGVYRFCSDCTPLHLAAEHNAC